MWAVKDSNLRTRERTDLQSVAFNHSANYPVKFKVQRFKSLQGNPLQLINK